MSLIPLKYWQNASSLIHNSLMSRYHLHTGMCKCTGCSGWNTWHLMTVLHSCTFGLNKRSMKMLMNYPGRNNWAQSVTKSTSKLIFSLYTNTKLVLNLQNRKNWIYLEPACLGTAIAGATTNPQNITASVNLHMKFPWRRTQLHLCKVKPALSHKFQIEKK